jgi:hypothetical protein
MALPRRESGGRDVRQLFPLAWSNLSGAGLCASRWTSSACGCGGKDLGTLLSSLRCNPRSRSARIRHAVLDVTLPIQKRALRSLRPQCGATNAIQIYRYPPVSSPVSALDACRPGGLCGLELLAAPLQHGREVGTRSPVLPRLPGSGLRGSSVVAAERPSYGSLR